MKTIVVKRLVFTAPEGESHIGEREFDGSLDDFNILGAYHEVGRTVWIGSSLWTLRNGIPRYRVTVESFYQCQKNWFDLILDAVRRI